MTYPKAPDEWFNRKIAEGQGIFDRKSFEAMINSCKNFRTAIDCGAHVGTWSIGMAKKFQKVYAIEPTKSNFSYLTENIHGINNIFAIPIALGGKEGMVHMGNNKDANSGQAHIMNETDGSVPLTTLDIWFPTLENVDLLKIDVEGYELNVLLGARNLIERNNPVIQVELNGLGKRYGVTDGDVQDYLKYLGYILVSQNNKDYVYVCQKHIS